MWSPTDGSLAEMTVLITGANTGIGFESAQRLAGAGARVIVTARDQDRANTAAAKIRAPVAALGLELDLASLESIRSLPDRLGALEVGTTIDVLINNAQGESPLYSKRAANGNGFERTTTKDGFDRIVGTSHLGHFALVAALLPSLKSSRRGFRIINVSSESHRSVTRGAIFYALEQNFELTEPSAFERYSIAKAANVLFAVELQRRLDEARLPGSAVVVGLHDPRYDLLHPDGPASNAHVWLAAAADSGGSLTRRGGLYFASETHAPQPPSEPATDPRLARKLWEVSEKLTGATISI